MEYNRFAFRSLPRATRHRIILQDVKNELAIVQEMTRLALLNDPEDKPKDFDAEDDDFSF